MVGIIIFRDCVSGIHDIVGDLASSYGSDAKPRPDGSGLLGRWLLRIYPHRRFDVEA